MSNPILALILKLRASDDALQVALRDLYVAYYQFVHSPRVEGRKVVNKLILRQARDRDGRIRRLYWAARSNARKKVGVRTIRLSKCLKGPFRSAWIYRLAHDWRRRSTYWQFESRRSLLVSLRSAVVRTLRSINLWLRNGWTHRATDQDRSSAQGALQASSPQARSQDVLALIGACAFARTLRALETEIGLAIEDYRRAFSGRAWIYFEPALRQNEDGTIRLYWGFPERVGTSRGIRTFTHYIQGRPTDAWMRKARLPERARREIGAFLKRLLPLERRYRKLVGFLGRYRRRVHELLARIARNGMGTTRAPAGAGAAEASKAAAGGAGAGLPRKGAL